MKEKEARKLYNSMTNVKEDYIEEARKEKAKRKHPVMLAAFLFVAGGLPLILLIDLASFVFAFCVLLFFITIPEQGRKRNTVPHLPD